MDSKRCLDLAEMAFNNNDKDWAMKFFKRAQEIDSTIFLKYANANHRLTWLCFKEILTNNCLFINLDLYKRIHSFDFSSDQNKQGPTTMIENPPSTVNPEKINK